MGGGREEVQCIALMKGKRNWCMPNACVLMGVVGTSPAAASLTPAAREGWQTAAQLCERDGGSAALYAFLHKHGLTDVKEVGGLLPPAARTYECSTAALCLRCQPPRGARPRAPVAEI